MAGVGSGSSGDRECVPQSCSISQRRENPWLTPPRSQVPTVSPRASPLRKLPHPSLRDSHSHLSQSRLSIKGIHRLRLRWQERGSRAAGQAHAVTPLIRARWMDHQTQDPGWSAVFGAGLWGAEIQMFVAQVAPGAGVTLLGQSRHSRRDAVRGLHFARVPAVNSPQSRKGGCSVIGALSIDLIRDLGVRESRRTFKDSLLADRKSVV